MSKVMRPTAMRDLLARIVGEWGARRSIFEIDEATMSTAFELAARSPGFELFGTRVALPVGPAAGPHTQIAPNLVASYLAGARVFELKTVQVNDRIEVEKPCIDALDEGYNVEWSTELSLEEAQGEYLRAWAAIHLLDALLAPRVGGASPAHGALERSAQPGLPSSLIFNLSVGYTLEGIKSPRMEAFIEGMRHPEGSEPWREIVDALRTLTGGDELARAFGPAAARRAREAVERLPAEPIHSVTLSTMHGCPPAEIERIGRYLIEAKGLATLVKLNPTLLGYERVRSILDATGWEGISIEPGVFAKDLQFDDALALIASLSKAAAEKGVGFGLKLSNTLATANALGRLPGAEMYLSGRALFPITVHLAAELSAAMVDPPPFSFCAGVSARNAARCVAAGLGPLTAATELLKPGGYSRLGGIAGAAISTLSGAPSRPSAALLAALARDALGLPEHRAGYKEGQAAIARKLPLFDCFSAPCIEACPVNQQAPAYIRALAGGKPSEALAVVLEDNPLPLITGLLCDHACMSACSRVDYEGPVAIRGVKLACATAAELPAARSEPVRGRGRTAVFGAGPAGLACAHYLALAGYPVVVFERAPSAGGVVANIIPRFRIGSEQVQHDIERIRALGAEFRFGHPGEVDLGRLRAEGFSSFVLASGAPVGRRLPVSGAGVPTVEALDFLAACRGEAAPFAQATSVVIAGGGNTAMDAARVAVRLPGVRRVKILYRRTREEMPADREELEEALAEGVELVELRVPERLEAGRVIARVMSLGERDPSGRRSPRPTERTEDYRCDLLVTAVGEGPDSALLARLGLAVGADGRPAFDPESLETSVTGLYVAGDAARGASSIIRAEADGRRVARAILGRAGVVGGTAAAPEGSAAAGVSAAPTVAPEAAAAVAGAAPIVPAGAAASARAATVAPRPLAVIRAERGRLLDSLPPENPRFVAREADRCLSCDVACLRCVEVCPNRANLALPVDGVGAFAQSPQILHVDDLCNECGNCGFFCPYEGDPYRGKPTLFSSEETLRASRNDGFFFAKSSRGYELLMRLHGETARVPIDPSPADPAGGGPAAGSARSEPRFAQLYALARTVLVDHPYLIPGGRA